MLLSSLTLGPQLHVAYWAHLGAQDFIFLPIMEMQRRKGKQMSRIDVNDVQDVGAKSAVPWTAVPAI